MSFYVCCLFIHLVCSQATNPERKYDSTLSHASRNNSTNFEVRFPYNQTNHINRHFSYLHRKFIKVKSGTNKIIHRHKKAQKVKLKQTGNSVRRVENSTKNAVKSMSSKANDIDNTKKSMDIQQMQTLDRTFKNKNTKLDVFDYTNRRIKELGQDALLIPKLFTENNAEKKAITPISKKAIRRFRHHNETHRPEFPMKDIAPQIIERELGASGSGDGGPDKLPFPPPAPPPPAPPIIIPPAAPAAPVVINTAPGPGAGSVVVGDTAGGGPGAAGPAGSVSAGTGGGGGPDWGGAGDGAAGGEVAAGAGGGATEGGGGGGGEGGEAPGSDAKSSALSDAANEKLKSLENIVQALANKVDNEAVDADTSPQNSGPTGALNDMMEKMTDKINTINTLNNKVGGGADWVGTINGIGPNEQERPNSPGTSYGSGPTGSSGSGGRPTQVASGLLGGQLYKLEEVISNLNKKVDGIGQNLDHKPTELERASLLAGMTSTFGNLENTIESLSGKITAGLQQPPQQPPGQSEHDAEATALLASKIGHLEGSMLTLSDKIKLLSVANQGALEKAMQSGINSERIKSNARLEESMKMLADRMTGLAEHLAKPPPAPLPAAPVPPAQPVPLAPPPSDPQVTQQQTQLIAAQTDLTKQMADIQKGIGVLSETLANAKEKPASPPPPPPPEKPPPWIGLAKAVLKNAADSFSEAAKASEKSASDFSKNMGKTVTDAKKMMKSDDLLKILKKLPPASTAAIASAGPLGGGLGGLGAGMTSMGGIGAGLGGGFGAPIAPLAANIASMPVPAAPVAPVFPDVSAGLFNLNAGIALPTPPTPSVFTGTNPLNFGTHGNGSPQLGVVTGNLGGSLGLGGMGGIDGGNALIMNQTISNKKFMICKGKDMNCFWKGTKRHFIHKNRQFLHVQKRHRCSLEYHPRRTVRSYVIRPISAAKAIANKLLQNAPTPMSTESLSKLPLAEALHALSTPPALPDLRLQMSSSRSDSPKQPAPGGNMASAISNLLTQRLTDQQKYGPKIITAAVNSANVNAGPIIDPAKIAAGIGSGIASGTQAMLQNLGEQLNLRIGDAAAQGAATGSVMRAPKDGSIGTGTGGYTSSLGRFNDHLGYGGGLFGQGVAGNAKSSGMVTPDIAAGKIAAMSSAAADASSATSNTARMIQENLWGRNVQSHAGTGKDSHMDEWKKFFGELPHHSEKGITMGDESHGEDHNKHYFDHGEHGTGEDNHHHVYGHHTEYGHHDEWGFGDTGQYGHHHKWEEGPNGVFEHFGDWGKEHDNDGHHEDHHEDNHHGNEHEEHHEGHHEDHHGEGDHDHDHHHTHHDHGHYHYIEVEHGHNDGGHHGGHNGDMGWFGHHQGDYGMGGGGGNDGGMRRGFGGGGYGGGGYGGGGGHGGGGGGYGGESYGGGGYGDGGGGYGGGGYGDGGGGYGEGGNEGNGGGGGMGGGGGDGGGYGHHGGHEDDEGHHGYHHNGEYGRLHLPVHSFLDHGGRGHNLRPLHGLHELHGGRQNRFYGDHEVHHDPGHRMDFLSHGLSYHGHHHLDRLHHKYHPEGTGHHYEYHQNHDDDYDHGNHHNFHHDDHMEDEHDTDHSHHIGWVHHDDDDAEDHSNEGERHGSHHDDEEVHREGGHHEEDGVHDHYDNEMEHHEGEGHDGGHHGHDDVHDEYDDEMEHHEGDQHHSEEHPVDSTVAGITDGGEYSKAAAMNTACKKSKINCYSPPIEVNIKSKNGHIGENDMNEIQNIIDGRPFHKEYNEIKDDGEHRHHSHEDIAIDNGRDSEVSPKEENVDDRSETERDGGEREQNRERNEREDEEEVEKEPAEGEAGNRKTHFVTDAKFIDSILPSHYKEDEKTRIQETLNKETKALADLYNHPENNGDDRKGPEEKFMEKASRLTGTSWGLDSKGYKKDVVKKTLVHKARLKRDAEFQIRSKRAVAKKQQLGENEQVLKLKSSSIGDNRHSRKRVSLHKKKYDELLQMNSKQLVKRVNVTAKKQQLPFAEKINMGELSWLLNKETSNQPESASKMNTPSDPTVDVQNDEDSQMKDSLKDSQTKDSLKDSQTKDSLKDRWTEKENTFSERVGNWKNKHEHSDNAPSISWHGYSDNPSIHDRKDSNYKHNSEVAEDVQHRYKDENNFSSGQDTNTEARHPTQSDGGYATFSHDPTHFSNHYEDRNEYNPIHRRRKHFAEKQTEESKHRVHGDQKHYNQEHGSRENDKLNSDNRELNSNNERYYHSDDNDRRHTDANVRYHERNRNKKENHKDEENDMYNDDDEDKDDDEDDDKDEYPGTRYDRYQTINYDDEPDDLHGYRNEKEDENRNFNNSRNSTEAVGNQAGATKVENQTVSIANNYTSPNDSKVKTTQEENTKNNTMASEHAAGEHEVTLKEEGKVGDGSNKSNDKANETSDHVLSEYNRPTMEENNDSYHSNKSNNNNVADGKGNETRGAHYESTEKGDHEGLQENDQRAEKQKYNEEKNRKHTKEGNNDDHEREEWKNVHMEKIPWGVKRSKQTGKEQTASPLQRKVKFKAIKQKRKTRRKRDLSTQGGLNYASSDATKSFQELQWLLSTPEQDKNSANDGFQTIEPITAQGDDRSNTPWVNDYRQSDEPKDEDSQSVFSPDEDFQPHFANRNRYRHDGDEDDRFSYRSFENRIPKHRHSWYTMGLEREKIERSKKVKHDEKHFPLHEVHNGHSLRKNREDEEKEREESKLHHKEKQNEKDQEDETQHLGDLEENHDHDVDISGKEEEHEKGGRAHEEKQEHNEGMINHEPEKEHSEHQGEDETHHDEIHEEKELQHGVEEHDEHTTEHHHHGVNEQSKHKEEEEHKQHHREEEHHEKPHEEENKDVEKEHRKEDHDEDRQQGHEEHKQHKTHTQHHHKDHDDGEHEHEDDDHDKNDNQEEDEEEHHMGEDIHGWSGYSKDHLKLFNPSFAESLIPSELKELEERRLQHKVNKETKELIHLFDDITEHKVKEPESRFIGEASHLIGTKWGLNGDLGYKVHYPYIPHGDHEFHHIVVNINDEGEHDYNSHSEDEYSRYRQHNQYENAYKRSPLKWFEKGRRGVVRERRKMGFLKQKRAKWRRKPELKTIRKYIPNNILNTNNKKYTARGVKRDLLFRNCGLQGEYKEGGQMDIAIDDMKFKPDCDKKETSDTFTDKDSTSSSDNDKIGNMLYSDINNDDGRRFGTRSETIENRSEHDEKGRETERPNMNDRYENNNVFSSSERDDGRMIRDGAGSEYRNEGDSFEKPFSSDDNRFDKMEEGSRKDKTSHDANTDLLQWDHDELDSDDHGKTHGSHTDDNNSHGSHVDGEHVDDDHDGEHKSDKSEEHEFEDTEHDTKGDHHGDEHHEEEHKTNEKEHEQDHGDSNDGDIDEHNMVTGHYHPHDITTHHNHGDIDEQFHNYMRNSREAQHLPSIGHTLDHLHGHEIGYTKNQNTGQGWHGNHAFGHDYLENGHHGTTSEFSGGDEMGHSGSSHGERGIGYYGPIEGDGVHSTVRNEGHTVPLFTYGAHGGDHHDINDYGHSEGMHGAFHHGVQDGMPVDDHPAHYLFRHFTPGDDFSDLSYEHSLDDHLAHHAMHGGLQNHHGDHHERHDHHHLDEHDFHEMNPLDYHIPLFPSRKNNYAINHFFEHETLRIAQHVNEFPLISDKQSVHPSVFRDQMDMLPSTSDFNTLSVHGMRHVKAGGRYAAGGTLIGAGTVGYGAVGRPSVGIGIAAGGSAGAGILMSGKAAPLKALLQKAANQISSPKTRGVAASGPHLADKSEAPPIINLGYPQYNIPKAETTLITPDIYKPPPLPFGPNPYQIITSEGLGYKDPPPPPPQPSPSFSAAFYNQLTSEGKPTLKKEDDPPADSPPAILADPKPPKAPPVKTPTDAPPAIGTEPKPQKLPPGKKPTDAPPAIGTEPKPPKETPAPKQTPEPPGIAAAPTPSPQPKPSQNVKPINVLLSAAKKPQRKQITASDILFKLSQYVPTSPLPKLLVALNEMTKKA